MGKIYNTLVSCAKTSPLITTGKVVFSLQKSEAYRFTSHSFSSSSVWRDRRNTHTNVFCQHVWLIPAHHISGSISEALLPSRQQGSFFRLYYPCQETEKAEKPDWVPSREYFNGLADFMKINRSLSERIFNYLFGNCAWLTHQTFQYNMPLFCVSITACPVKLYHSVLLPVVPLCCRLVVSLHDTQLIFQMNSFTCITQQHLQ